MVRLLGRPRVWWSFRLDQNLTRNPPPTSRSRRTAGVISTRDPVSHICRAGNGATSNDNVAATQVFLTMSPISCASRVSGSARNERLWRQRRHGCAQERRFRSPRSGPAVHREHPRWTRRRDRAAGNGVAGGEDGGRRRDGADRATPVVTAGRARAPSSANSTPRPLGRPSPAASGGRRHSPPVEVPPARECPACGCMTEAGDRPECGSGYRGTEAPGRALPSATSRSRP